jgi:hypothetical protein
VASKFWTSTGHRTGRSSCRYGLRVDDAALRPFGFRADETVTHIDFGRGRVVGAFGGRLWLTWDGESGLSTGNVCDPFVLHGMLEIEAPKDREIRAVTVGRRRAHVKTAPCGLLGRYDLSATDVV